MALATARRGCRSGCVPSDSGFRWQTIYLRIGSGGAGHRATLVERCKVVPSRSWATDLAGGIEYVLNRVDITRVRAGVDWRTIQPQAKETNDPLAPGVQLGLARRMGICVDDAG